MFTFIAWSGEGKEAVIVAAGDISCPKKYEDRGICQGPEVFRAFSRYRSEVLALGDLLQKSPTVRKSDYRKNFLRSWPLTKKTFRPVAGNHDYPKSGGDKKGYNAFLASLGLEKMRNWYSWNKGNWHLVALNSNCDLIDCRLDGRQLTWLAKDLEKNKDKCLALYMHHPLFFAKDKKSIKNLYGLKNIWRLAYLYRVNFILNGHLHYYERSQKVDPKGEETSSGIRQFTVGTGGVELVSLGQSKTREVAKQEFGFLELRLGSDYYKWSFQTKDNFILDQGEDSCSSSQGQEGLQEIYQKNLGKSDNLQEILKALM